MTGKYSLLVIGGSAGSLEVLLELFPLLKKDLRLAVLVVLHRKSNAESFLQELLRSRTALPVKEAEDKDGIQPGHVYVAPADYHLLVEEDRTLSLDISEKVQFSRPSIDVTFETAADALGPGLVCLLLSGANSDGTEGLKQVKERGGLVAVQNPATAGVSFMPLSALSELSADVVLESGEMAAFINGLDAL